MKTGERERKIAGWTMADPDFPFIWLPWVLEKIVQDAVSMISSGHTGPCPIYFYSSLLRDAAH